MVDCCNNFDSWLFSLKRTERAYKSEKSKNGEVIRG